MYDLWDKKPFQAWKNYNWDTIDFEDFIGTNQRRIMDNRELGRIMSEFRIEDPFEICFALIYMIGYVDDTIGERGAVSRCFLFLWGVMFD